MKNSVIALALVLASGAAFATDDHGEHGNHSNVYFLTSTGTGSIAGTGAGVVFGTNSGAISYSESGAGNTNSAQALVIAPHSHHNVASIYSNSEAISRSGAWGYNTTAQYGNASGFGGGFALGAGWAGAAGFGGNAGVGAFQSSAD
ncbi:MAG: hypothetical protein QXN55_00585 [Candidatus Nitrosotenuis sp.]